MLTRLRFSARLRTDAKSFQSIASAVIFISVFSVFYYERRRVVMFPMAPINLLFFLVFFVILKDDRTAVIRSKSTHCSSSEISAEFAVGCHCPNDQLD